MPKYQTALAVPLDLTFQALGDPTRRAMVEELSRGPATVTDLATALKARKPISLPAVMQHLAILEGSGLVASEKIGRTRTCRIEPKALRSVEDWVIERRATWERRFDRLASFLDETKPEDE